MRPKKLITLIFIFNYILLLVGSDLEKIDDLHHKGLYEESYKELEKMFDPDNPEAAIIWRIGRIIFVLADQVPWYKRNEKIEKFNEGASFLEKYLDIKNGSERDRASIYHWYDSNLALKYFNVGIFESLKNLNKIIEFNDLAIEIDPTYADSYYFKASLNDTLPAFLGGNDTKMGYYYQLALKYAPLDINIMIDAAKAFHKRNWDTDKVKKEYEELRLEQINAINLNDREYAKELIKKAIGIFESNNDPSYHDKIKIKEAYDLKSKWTK